MSRQSPVFANRRGGGACPERSEGTGVGVDLIELSENTITRIIA